MTLSPDQEIFFFKKVNIRIPETFSAGIDRFAVGSKSIVSNNTYYEKEGDIFWNIKGAKGLKETSKEFHRKEIDQWFLSRDEALAFKINIMKSAIRNCDFGATRSIPKHNLKYILQQRQVLKLVETYPEVLI